MYVCLVFTILNTAQTIDRVESWTLTNLYAFGRRKIRHCFVPYRTIDGYIKNIQSTKYKNRQYERWITNTDNSYSIICLGDEIITVKINFIVLANTMSYGILFLTTNRINIGFIMFQNKQNMGYFNKHIQWNIIKMDYIDSW